MSALCFLKAGYGELAFDDEDDILRSLGENHVPQELDTQKFNRGRVFFKNNVGQCLTAMLFSLVCGLSIRRFLEVLVSTDMSSTPEMSLKRYMRTAVHVLNWHYSNVWDVSSCAYESIMAVRKKHRSARRLMQDQRLNKSFPEETADCGNKNKEHAYLSQYDMGIVQCGFMGAIIMYPEQLGIRCCRDDLDDYVYFWRWIGFLLGIDDRYNICLGGYESAYRICKAIDSDVLIPSLLNPPEKFLPMARAFTDGVGQLSLISWFTPESVVARYFQVSCREYRLPVSVRDTCRMYLVRVYLAAIYYFPAFAAFINWRIERLFNCSKFE